MTEAFVLEANTRADKGKGASRRLRHQNLVPAIIYGSDSEPQPITVELKALVKQLENEAFYSHILSLNIDNKTTKVVLKDLQRHPAKNTPMHADFLRVDENSTIRMNVPLHFINEDACVGVKAQGGSIDHQLTEVEIVCLPQNLPEYIEVDMLALSTGESVHLTDLKVPEGVSIYALIQGLDHDQPVARVVAKKVKWKK